MRQRYRNSVKNACSYPGADADTDHNLVIITAKAKIKETEEGKENHVMELGYVEYQL